MSQRAAGLVVALIGALVFVLSFSTWGICPTTPCGGILMTFSEYSRIDLGFGTFTVVLALVLIAIGIAGLLRPGRWELSLPAAAVAGVIVPAAIGAILWMHVIPGEDKEFVSIPYRAVTVAVLGVIALGASRYLRRSPAQVSGKSPT